MNRLQVAILLILSAQTVAAESVSLAGVSIGMSLDEVVALKGEPDWSRKALDWFSLESQFGSLTVYGSQQVEGLRSKNPGDCMKQGICPRQKYDGARLNPYNVEDLPEGKRYIFKEVGEYCSTQVKVVTGYIEEIEIVCSPD